MIDLTKPTGAVFSEDRCYRYVLWRRWNAKLPVLMAIGLNPSTANENTNDKTISNLVEIARRHSYGTLLMCNLFALVSTDPKVVATHENPFGDNDNHLFELSNIADDIAYVWGNFKFEGFNHQIGRVKLIIERSDRKKILCLGNNKNGTPKHPCRLSYNTKLVNFNNESI